MKPRFHFHIPLMLGVAILAACSSQQVPETTYDGLVLKPDTEVGAVYVRPGASLEGFTEFGLVPCQVAFRKNWLRDQNRDRVDLSQRITQKDVDRIKDQLSSECDRYFREALAQAPAYNVVEEFQEGERVLILRPNIINLDVAAPDIMSAGRTRTYTTDAGEMTLFLEVLDATTHEILVRVVDRRRSMDTARLQWTNSVTNRAEAERMLRYWAGKLRKALDAAVAVN